MTIRVKIGSIEKDISEVDPNWINEQINRRRAEGITVCVQVSIISDSVNLHLATSECPPFSGVSRVLSTEENGILSLWNKLHLHDKDFSGGNLVAFLKQIKSP
jgi:hypothetical protein